MQFHYSIQDLLNDGGSHRQVENQLTYDELKVGSNF